MKLKYDDFGILSVKIILASNNLSNIHEDIKRLCKFLNTTNQKQFIQAVPEIRISNRKN